MYYVATPDRPYQNDKLHHGENLGEMSDWAEGEARVRGIDLDVRMADTRAVCASFDSKGNSVPARKG